jgi:hypothetical protein
MGKRNCLFWKRASPKPPSFLHGCTHLSISYIKPCDSPLLNQQPNTPPSSTNRDHEEISSSGTSFPSSGLLTVVVLRQFLRRDYSSSSSLQEERHQAEAAAGRHQKGQEAQEGGAAFQCRRREAQLHLQGCHQVLCVYIIMHTRLSHLCISIVCCLILSISIRILSPLHSFSRTLNLSVSHSLQSRIDLLLLLKVRRHASEVRFLNSQRPLPPSTPAPPHALISSTERVVVLDQRERDG